MYTARLESELRDLDMLLAAIESGEYPAAQSIAIAMRRNLSERLQAALAPRTSTYPQNKLLARLTGWSLYPPRYWQEKQLTPAQASDLINDLKLMGEATLDGKTYYRVTTERQEKRRAANARVKVPAKQRRQKVAA